MVFREGRVEGKVALVTGGARGIGFAIAQRLHEEGAAVVIGDINLVGAQDAAEKLGGSAVGVKLDVTDLAAWESCLEEITSQLGGLDILVNNAGGTAEGRISTATVEAHQKVLELNLSSVWMGCKAALPVMTDRGGGSIVNISSIMGIAGVGGLGTYVAAKFGVTGLTQALAQEFGPANIRVNSVHPGITASENVRKSEGTLAWEIMTNAINDQPIKRMGNVRDIAHAVLFFSSDESSYCTGTKLVVDGGQLSGPARRPSYSSVTKNKD